MNGNSTAVIGIQIYLPANFRYNDPFHYFYEVISLKLFIHTIALGLLFSEVLLSQTAPFKNAGKWGIKDQERVVIQPVYDTIVNFDSTGKTCLACYKTIGASANKFIKVYTKTYLCNYINRDGKYLSVKSDGNDTCSVFTLNKHTVRQFSENRNYFVVVTKNKKYLVDRDFNQITRKGYHDINFCAEPSFLLTSITNDGFTIYTGLINFREEQIIPYQYADLKVNPVDSLIVACSAGIKVNTEDDVFDYHGKKLGTYRRHVDMVTKNYVIYKLFEPKEYYITYNPITKEEKELFVEDVKIYKDDEVLVRIKNDWYIYSLSKGEKKPVKQS